MYFSAENPPGVNPEVMNYKITIGQQLGQQGIVLRGQTAFPLIFVVSEEWKNTVWTCEATCKGSHGGRLAQCVS